MNVADFDELPGLVEAVAASLAVIDLREGNAGRVVACNCQFRNMLGMRTGEGPGRPLREFVPRYAWRDVMSQIEECARCVAPVETVQPFDLQGQARWWRISAQPIVNGAREPTAILLTCIEITEKVELEEALKTANSRFGAVIQSAYDGIVTIDRDHRIKLFNAAAEEMFGYRADEVVGMPLDMLIPARYRGRHEQHVEQFAGSPIQSRQMFERGGRISGVAKDGTEFSVEVSIAKIQVDGSTEFTAIVRDISERARLIDELRRQATVDLLTGLLNRRAFYDRASDTIALARRHDHPLSVLMIDLDCFKETNDAQGHAAGDAVLRAAAAAGRSVLRKTDIFARIGGEEFAVLLPETGEEQAALLAERLRRTIEEARFEHDWDDIDPIAFTASIGVAPCLKEDELIDDGLKRADRALYAAKREGRNRVMRWSALPEATAETALERGAVRTRVARAG